MKIVLPLAAATAVFFAAGAASAQSMDATVYGNIGYTGVFANIEDGDDVNLGGITGRVGAKFGQYVGVEGEATFGIQEDEVRTLGVDVDVKLENEFAGYLVGYAPLSPNTELLARIGYGQISIEAEAGGFTASEDSGSWAYGVGAQHFFDGVNGVRADYTRFDISDDGGEADSLSISYVRRF